LQQHAREITQLNEELLLALSHAVDLRDPDVQDHSKNVARYATLIAQELNLPPERVELVRKAGLLHDIGKLGIPETILFKPARLTATEYDIIKQHSDMGADIVAEAHSLQAIVPFIRHHHERFDGQGYPAGLPGPEIPLEARILSVADTVEAMASDRPYRRAQSPADILAEIQNHAGTQFDPTVVNAFVKVVKGAGEAIIVNSSRTAALLHYADALHPRREALVLA
jgi:putative nucleotidyltransferase with HDIG domain